LEKKSLLSIETFLVSLTGAGWGRERSRRGAPNHLAKKGKTELWGQGEPRQKAFVCSREVNVFPKRERI